MRLLAAADIHGVISVYEWLAAVASEQRADLLILAGDLFASDWEDGQREQAQQIIAVLKGTGVPCFYLMGNDDNVALGYEDERIRSVHGRRFSFGNYNFVGYQHSPPFVGTVFVKPEAEIENDLLSLETLLDKQTVFITHAPAYATLDVSYAGEHCGSRSIATLFDRRPVLAHIHGHIHDSFGRDGNHFNVAAAGQRRAIVIDLPWLNHKVLNDEDALLRH